MIDSILNFLSTPVGPGVALAIQFAIGVPIAYLIVRGICSPSTTGRWKMARVVLTILFLPLVLIWKVATAGSDCGCCCDEDD
jgi:hypothetical protein